MTYYIKHTTMNPYIELALDGKFEGKSVRGRPEMYNQGIMNKPLKSLNTDMEE